MKAGRTACCHGPFEQPRAMPADVGARPGWSSRAGGRARDRLLRCPPAPPISSDAVLQDGGRSKEKLTCGAHTSVTDVSEKHQGCFGPYIRCVYVYGLTVGLDTWKT
jgi:hypothetical protein